MPGYGGDGGAATSAQLANPVAVAVDAHGNLYIADNGNNRVRLVTTAGIITTYAGTGTGGHSGDGGPATNAALTGPDGVAIDSAGNLYISDVSNHIVRKVTAGTAIISTLAGTGGIAGSLGDGGLAGIAQLSGPTGLAVDVGGNVYIVDTDGNRVREVVAQRIFTPTAVRVRYRWSRPGNLPFLTLI
jgi:sugar lactone lactonase YvrE